MPARKLKLHSAIKLGFSICGSLKKVSKICWCPDLQNDSVTEVFFNWDSLHAKLDSHYEAWSYKKKKRKKIKAYRKSVLKEPTVKRYLLILDLKPLRSYVKGKHSIGRELQSLAVQGKKLLT